jgi:hypothetical protein
VRTSNTAVKVDKEQYLRDLYTNDDGEMVCQICRDEMPFRRLADDQYSFEAVEFLKSTTSELSVNYLALCPTCAAKFHHANGSSLDSLRQALLTTPTLEVSIVLAWEEQTIAFVRDHLEDLRAVVEGETLCPDLGEVLRTIIGPASLAGQLAMRSP